MFPVLVVFDSPGQQEKGFLEWPLFSIYKVRQQEGRAARRR